MRQRDQQRARRRSNAIMVTLVACFLAASVWTLQAAAELRKYRP